MHNYVLSYKCCNVSGTRKHENDMNTDGWAHGSHIKNNLWGVASYLSTYFLQNALHIFDYTQ